MVNMATVLWRLVKVSPGGSQMETQTYIVLAHVVQLQQSEIAVLLKITANYYLAHVLILEKLTPGQSLQLCKIEVGYNVIQLSSQLII